MIDIMYFSIISLSLSLSLSWYIFQGGLVYAKREIAPKDAKKNVPTVQYNDCRVLQQDDIDGLPFALPLQKFHFFLNIL